MIHPFPRLFTLPAKAHEAPPPGPLAPWWYIRLRREAAGLSHAQVAEKLIRHAGEFDMALRLLRELETPGITARLSRTISRLAACFPLDPSVYAQLASEPAERHPRVCHRCGASEWDADDFRGDGPLRWTGNSLCHRHEDASSSLRGVA